MPNIYKIRYNGKVYYCEHCTCPVEPTADKCPTCKSTLAGEVVINPPPGPFTWLKVIIYVVLALSCLFGLVNLVGWGVSRLAGIR